MSAPTLRVPRFATEAPASHARVADGRDEEARQALMTMRSNVEFLVALLSRSGSPLVRATLDDLEASVRDLERRFDTVSAESFRRAA